MVPSMSHVLLLDNVSCSVHERSSHLRFCFATFGHFKDKHVSKPFCDNSCLHALHRRLALFLSSVHDTSPRKTPADKASLINGFSSFIARICACGSHVDFRGLSLQTGMAQFVPPDPDRMTTGGFAVTNGQPSPWLESTTG
ncbi:unnamed protein product [Bathycoccus prasinos]